jgi:hypothetical protein
MDDTQVLRCFAISAAKPIGPGGRHQAVSIEPHRMMVTVLAANGARYQGMIGDMLCRLQPVLIGRYRRAGQKCRPQLLISSDTFTGPCPVLDG